LPGRFDSNGERIYFTATSQSGQPIVPEVLGMHQMHSGRMACADCHGPEGRGGTITVMMDTFDAPDIRYSTLTADEHEHGEAEEAGHEEHPAYTDETIKRAITEGIDPAGEPLEWPMPRWRMSESDLEDLVTYLTSME
jgi:mono/diheme cytochrome c family protein